MRFSKKEEIGNQGCSYYCFLRSLFITIQGAYDIVDVVWNLGSYIKGKTVVDLVYSRDSNYLRIRAKCFDQVNI